MMRLSRTEIPTARLIELAASIGADVPFFLFGGTALGVGRGDEIYPLPEGPHRTLLVVSPRDIAVRTADAYSWLGAALTKRPNAHKLHVFCALCWSAQEVRLFNDFEAAVFPRHPRLKNIKRELLQKGAAEASLAGSGSAVFALFRNPAQARRAAQGFPQDQVFICDTISRGEYRRAHFGRGGA
jgi:4-diphosphocytidyl-2-C-methyl-D-erythritol kinase